MPAKDKRTRIDLALVARGLVESREKAKRLIMAGQIRINQSTARKPSDSVLESDQIHVLQPEKYVSRGGYKLEGALHEFPVSPKDRVCLDLGASTGGFTDCLLQSGATLVHSVDVGKGQIHWKLQQDPRVRVWDELNARHLKPDLLIPPPTFLTADVSFISLTKVLPAALACLHDSSECIILIKPQFEAERSEVGSGGVIRDPAIHEKVLDKLRRFIAQYPAATWHSHLLSPLEGPAGNKEFLAWFSWRPVPPSSPLKVT